ncbi:hypothetical protein SAMN05216325_10141 [Nitrosomonas marina]|uniref:Uncharacterized protein n=2 Tax=Nitrosomonas marina TaxID=917 RepID=A0A1H8AC88_9PROT|nr:hypothetical protein SAMN05216325_10141 [Nitrosomonas marina]
MHIGVLGEKMTRTRISENIQTDVLTASRRRCCICYGLNGDLEIKRGQIAHLDKNRENNKLDNLAFLCMDHHDEYDSTTSQSKSFLLKEIKAFREELHNYWQTPEESTHIDIVTTTIEEIGLLPHLWKNQFLSLVPNGWKLVENYSTGEIWGSMVAMVEVLDLTEKDWPRYKVLYDVILPHVVKKMESEIILWGQYLTDDYKHKLQMSLRKLSQASILYRTLQVHVSEAIFIKNLLLETLINLKEVCSDASAEKEKFA